MRDITFGPEQTRSIWKNEGVYPLLDEAYDRILIYGDRRVFDPITAYGMSEAAASRTRFCGYLAPSPPRRSPAQVRDEVGAGALPLVTVSVGGGADGCALLRAYLAGLRSRIGPPVHSYVVTGPLLPEQDRHEIMEMIDTLPNVCTIDFDPDFAAVDPALPMRSSAWEATIRLPSRCTLANGRLSCPGCQDQRSKCCGPRDLPGSGWRPWWVPIP